MKHVVRRGALVLAALGLSAVPAVADVLVLSGSGGVVAEANQRIFVPVFEEETGWTIRQVSAEASRMAEIEAMVRAGSPIWDVSEISASNYPIAIRNDLLEPINYDLIDPDNELPSVARGEFGVVAANYSTVLIQNTERAPEGRAMESWADFWEVDSFPGPRSLRSGPEYNLEFALLADGVEMEELYDVLSTPEGIDRAFAKLDEIRDHIPVWWSSGAQSVQLLTDGEVFYATNYNGRVPAMQAEGIPVEIIWNGGALHTSYLGIIRGTQNLEAAHEYIRIRTMRPDLQLEYLSVLPYPSAAPGLIEMLDPEQAAQLPTHPDNLSVQFAANEEFWAENIDDIRDRWDEWLLE
jgi:putative spermidine/putrescine transport system substrate-binding protein